MSTKITTSSEIDTSTNDITPVIKVSFSKDDTVGGVTTSSSSVVVSDSLSDVTESVVGQVATKNNSPLSVTLHGAAASAGTLVYTGNSAALPNCYLNFKSNTFNNTGLTFRLKTGASLGSVGSTSNTWVDTDSAIPLTLTAAGAHLKVASAYGSKFYKLTKDKYISNESFAMAPSKNPSYTVFCFALASTDASASFANMLQRANSHHKFVDKHWDQSPKKLYNFSSPIDSKSGSTFISFSGSTLNSPDILLDRVLRVKNEAYLLNVVEKDFFSNRGKWQNYSLGVTQSNYLEQPRITGYSESNLFNLSSLPTLLTTPTAPVSMTVNDGVDTVYPIFSMFFVEMFAYFTGKVGVSQSFKSGVETYNELVFQTFVNGIKVFERIMAVSPDSDLITSKNYNITLNNQDAGDGTNSVTDMFLFDYLHGTSTSETRMRADSKQIVESIAFNNRGILIKNANDLKFADSTASLLFPPSIAHPYLNIYGKNS